MAFYESLSGYINILSFLFFGGWGMSLRNILLKLLSGMSFKFQVMSEMI